MSQLTDINALFDSYQRRSNALGGGDGRGGSSGGGGGGGDVPPKRTRVVLSCAPCRVSKLKCDRGAPCGNCMRKGRVDLCEYAPRPKRPPKPAKGMAARVRRLEGMLREMLEHGEGGEESEGGGEGGGGGVGSGVGDDLAMSSFGVSSAEYQARATSVLRAGETFGQAMASPDVRSPAQQQQQQQQQQAGSQGRMVRGPRATTFVGATHFMAMLDDIEDLKAYFDAPNEAEGDDDGDEDDVGGYGQGYDGGKNWHEAAFEIESPEQMLLAGGGGGRRPRSKTDLLALLPPRAAVDRLIARFFGSNTPAQCGSLRACPGPLSL